MLFNLLFLTYILLIDFLSLLEVSPPSKLLESGLNSLPVVTNRLSTDVMRWFYFRFNDFFFFEGKIMEMSVNEGSDGRKFLAVEVCARTPLSLILDEFRELVVGARRRLTIVEVSASPLL